MTIPVSEVVRLCKLRLEPIAGEEALQQAKEIVAAVIGAETSALAVHTWVQVTEEQMSMIGDLVEQRLSGQPLQYILGEWEFYGLPFYVDERALIPRQDTELLVETAISMVHQRGYQGCLDLSTGSGCIAVSIAKHAQISVTATDISADALELAQENAALNEVKVTFIESDLFDQIEGKFDLICCNPPYLSKEDMEHLQKEVTFEPALALYGGADGLDFYRRIAKDYLAHLNAGGVLLLEIGSTQAETATALFAEKTSVLNDLGGNPRVLVVEPNETNQSSF